MSRLSVVLITGGAGFIGAHVTRAILADDRYESLQVVVLDDLSGGFPDNVPDSCRVTFREGSITDHRLVDELFETFDVRFVFHLAAYAAEGLSHFIRRFRMGSPHGSAAESTIRGHRNHAGTSAVLACHRFLGSGSRFYTT